MKIVHAILISWFLVGSAAQAELIKCVDKDGNIIFADTMSQDCAGPVGGDDATPSTGVQADMHVNEDELQRRKEAAIQEKEDQVLLKTYLSVEEIEDVRDRRIEQIEARNFVTERYLQRLNQQLEELELAAADLAAASSDPGAPAELPADLKEDILSTRASIDDYEQRLAAGRAAQEQIREKFAADIARFQELTGVTAGN
jgi:hypothetical protein